jgi:hypothetical protein
MISYLPLTIFLNSQTHVENDTRNNTSFKEHPNLLWGENTVKQAKGSKVKVFFQGLHMIHV